MSMMMQTARAPFRADASQGDPGLFDFARSSLNFAARTALGMTGFGGAAGAVQGARARGVMGPPPRSDPFANVRRGRNGTQVATVPRPGVVGAVQRFLPGGATGMVELACPSGHRANKTSYFLKDGTFVEKGSRCVKRRQRNPLNPKAMSRAIGRIDGGKRFQNRMAQISTGKFTASGKRRSCG